MPGLANFTPYARTVCQNSLRISAVVSLAMRLNMKNFNVIIIIIIFITALSVRVAVVMSIRSSSRSYKQNSKGNSYSKRSPAFSIPQGHSVLSLKGVADCDGYPPGDPCAKSCPKRNCQLLSMTLNEVGFENVALHAMIKQRERLAALARFKSNVVKTLIATDVASRGLDIPTVELVINHSIPNVPKDYIHRVGRTARAGRAGTSISLVTPSDIRLIHAIEDMIHTKLKEYSVNDKEVLKILTQVKVTKREAEMKLDENDFYEKKLINKRKKMILEGKDPDEEEELKKKRLKRKRRKEKELNYKKMSLLSKNGNSSTIKI